MAQGARLYLPIETKVREFDAKLLLALYAAEAGFRVVLGGQAEVMKLLPRLEPGIFMGKGITSVNLKHTRVLEETGNLGVAWCEEGLVIFSPETYARDRVSARVFEKLARFYAWGGVQTRAIELKVPGAASRIEITGNPRVDLLREPYRDRFNPERDRLRERFGPFILVNTNFGLYNNYMGPDYFLETLMKREGRIKDAAHEASLRERMRIVEASYKAFQRDLPGLARAFPDHALVVRPHPSENHDAWRENLSGVANARVAHEGNVIPWLLAADVLVHSTCTTAVEAFFLGRPVVAYRPHVSPDNDPELPKLVSLHAHDPAELAELTGRCLRDPEKAMTPVESGATRAAIEDFLTAIDGPFACERIVASLKELSRGMEHAARPPLSVRARVRGRQEWIAFKDFIKRALGRDGKFRSYAAQKFPGIPAEEVRRAAGVFAGVSGRFAGVVVRPVGGARSCFEFRANP